METTFNESAMLWYDIICTEYDMAENQMHDAGESGKVGLHPGLLLIVCEVLDSNFPSLGFDFSKWKTSSWTMKLVPYWIYNTT